MREPKKAETRKDEVRFRTSEPGQMFGKYIAENVYRKWTEDYLDENSGEVRKARLSIFAATPYLVSLVIEKEFCMAYADEEANN